MSIEGKFYVELQPETKALRGTFHAISCISWIDFMFTSEKRSTNYTKGSAMNTCGIKSPLSLRVWPLCHNLVHKSGAKQAFPKRHNRCSVSLRFLNTYFPGFVID